MRFDVITLFPEIIEAYCNSSIIGRAQKQEVISVNTTNPRDFSQNKHKKVDDTPYGGGAGMVLMCDPFFRAVESIEREDNSEIIMLTPQGETFTQQMSEQFARKEQLVFICGHYEGFDERIRQGLNVREVSLGDFVMTGGELASLCIIDSVTRHIEGALGKIESAHEDSFSDGLLEYPHYTRPVEYNGMVVPEVLRNGNHKEIDCWRRKQQILRTMKKRPDLFEKFCQTNLSKDDKILIKECKRELGE